jgi:hypothetical protein
MLALMKPKNAVTVSIIATVLKPPLDDRNDTRGRTVKRISSGSKNRNPTDDLEQHLRRDVAGLWLPPRTIKAGTRRF